MRDLIISIIRGEKKAPPLLKCILGGFSFIYQALVALRNYGYDLGILPSKSLPIQVISIGNITAGGTGKTPLVHLLALCLQDNLKLGILSRGFGSTLEKSNTVKQISLPNSTPEECGDEPYLLAQKTRAHLFVGADRLQSGALAVEQGVQCLLLDDGMQHRRLKRDIEIVLIDALRPLYQEKFLPLGMLRDSPKRLRKADLIVATHIKDKAHFERLQSELTNYTKAPLIGTQLQVINNQSFFEKRVGVFCGLGQPRHFLQTVRDLKAEIVETLVLNDHESLGPGQLERFAQICGAAGAEMLLCTEKDYVKLNHTPCVNIPIVPIQVMMDVAFGKEHWEELIRNILNKSNS